MRPLIPPHSLPPHLSPTHWTIFLSELWAKLILSGHSSGKVTKTLLEMPLLSHMDFQRQARSSTVTVTSALCGGNPHRGTCWSIAAPELTHNLGPATVHDTVRSCAFPSVRLWKVEKLTRGTPQMGFHVFFSWPCVSCTFWSMVGGCWQMKRRP